MSLLLIRHIWEKAAESQGTSLMYDITAAARMGITEENRTEIHIAQ